MKKKYQRLPQKRLYKASVFLPVIYFQIQPFHLSITYRSIQPNVFNHSTECGSLLTVKTLTSLNNILKQRFGTNLMVTTKIMTIVETIWLYRGRALVLITYGYRSRLTQKRV